MLYTLASEVQHEIVVKKSRFICYLIPCADKCLAKETIRKYKLQFPDASHVCSAFSCGGHTGLDDDGEPSGTAAKPIFQVLQMQKLDQVLAIVVRYFGGTKLGAGGMIRAYGGAVSETIKLADKCPVIAYDYLKCAVPFSVENKIRHFCHQQGLDIQSVSYLESDQVELTIEVAEVHAENIQQKLESLAAGQLVWSTGH